MHTLRCILSLWFHIMSHVMSVIVPCSCLLVVTQVLDQVACRTACMHTSLYMLLGLKLATIALGIAGFAPSRCDLSVLIKLQAASSIFTQTEDSSTFRPPTRAASARRSRACLPCACLWTSTCLCLTALFSRASIHILRAFYSADIGIPLIQPPISALRALWLRSWPANWTVSLNVTVSSRRYNGFSAAFDVSGPT